MDNADTSTHHTYHDHYDMEHICHADMLSWPLHTSTIVSLNPAFKIFHHSPNTDIYVSAPLSQGHMWEPEESLAFLERLRTCQSQHSQDHPIFVDIGANIGVHSLYISANHYETHAFEPMFHNFYLLQCSANANPEFGKKYLHINNVALASPSESGELCMKVDPVNQGHSYAAPPSESNDCIARVPITTLDDYWEKVMNKSRVCMMKIDVEGFESKVLAGAQRMFEEAPPMYLMHEFTVSFMRPHGIDPAAMIEKLKHRGYVYEQNSPQIDENQVRAHAYENDNPRNLWWRLAQ